jgi:hypothetical protein
MKQIFIAGLLFFAVQSSSRAQVADASQDEKEATYVKMITDRADKIVAKLNISDPAKFRRVSDIVAMQYRNLNDIYNRRDAALKVLKENVGGNKPDANAIKEIDAIVTTSVDSLHTIYLASLSSELTGQQVTQVKDGMTYGVLPLTYNAYVDELPNLTETQKKQIMDWLVEAREHSMDAESSKKKHDWFGKYKGRINNYLSKEGYDMKNAQVEWQKRINERQQLQNKN